MIKFVGIIILFVFLTGCQSAKDALTLKKKESSDEFLVEKKSPLIKPPIYGELPYPEDKDINFDSNEMKVTMGNDEIKINETIENSEPSSLEKSILDKIK